MFRKLISNLPYHPAVLEQVAFYSHRLRQEDSIRRSGFVVVILVLLLQMVTIISPSKPSLATSTNDIIYGATSKEQIREAYANNRDALGRNDIKIIYDHYGIGLEQISSAEPEKIYSTERDFISTGRGTSPGVDTFIPIDGVVDGGIYQRPLSNWDSGTESWYDTITGMSRYGFRFWLIINGCGNIVFENNALKPSVEITKKIIGSKIVSPGDTVDYLIEFRNTGPGTARNISITDDLPQGLSYLSYTSNTDLSEIIDGSSIVWKIANTSSELPPSQRWFNINLKLKVKSINSSKQVCNSSIISATGIASVGSQNTEEERCITITIPTCPGTGLPIPAGGITECTVTCPDGSVVAYNQTCSKPQLSCQSLKSIGEPSWDSRKFETTFVMQAGAELKQIKYYVDNQLVAAQPIIGSASSQLFTYKFSKEGTFNIEAALEATSGEVQPSHGCTTSVIITKPASPEPRINTDKTVTNLTQNITDANGTTANPGDKLKYTISVSNTGDATYHNLKLEGEYGESINDILEYSDLVDKEDASFTNQTNYLSWGSVDIQPGETIKKSFTVQIKSPLPTTPISASDPLSFDFTLQNRYGRLVTIKLDKPVTKIIEQTAKTLPNTGPGMSISLSIMLVIIIGYFYYRGRLLARETEIVRHSYNAGGI